MKSEILKISLKIYLFIQYISVIINTIIYIALVGMSLIILTLGGSSIKSIYQLLLFIFIFILLQGIFATIFIFVPIYSALATKNKISNKPLNKFQKFSLIIFNITTIPLYLILIAIKSISNTLLVGLDIIFMTITNHHLPFVSF